MEIIEKYKQEIKDYELKLQNLDNIEMELVDDTSQYIIKIVLKPSLLVEQ